MSSLRLITLSSPDELLGQAAAWDDLWRRSAVALPTARAEALALWLRQFAGRRSFRAVVVEQGGQFVAALPLCRRRLKGLVRVAVLPNCPWALSGDLLLDEECEVPAALDQLLAGTSKLHKSLLWLEGIDCQSARWQAWLAAAQRAGWSSDVHPIFDVGFIDAGQGWESYQAGLSGDFRRNLRRRTRQLEELGTLQLRSVENLCGHDLSSRLRRALEVEDASWKGNEGTSILRTPGMFEFFAAQAELLSRWDQLALHSLELDGRPIAFEYGYLAKGVYFAHKVSYLPEHHKLAPGHVLRWRLLPRLFERADFRGMDFFGKVTDAAERWLTRKYTWSRLVACPRRPVSRTLMAAYTKLWPRVRRLRQLVRRG